MATTPSTTKKNRHYRRVTPRTIALQQAKEQEVGNGSAAVRELEPMYSATDAGRRAWLIKQKAKQLDAGEFIDAKLQQIALNGMRVLEGLVNSSDEKIATRNVHFVIDHVRGKALQRSESKRLTLNIQTVLE